MTLVERESEMTALDALYEESTRYHGQVAVITSAPAMGKTALVTWLIGSVVERSATVFAATASQSERRLPLGVMDQLYQNGLRSTKHPTLLSDLVFDGPFDPAAPGDDLDGARQLALPVQRSLHPAVRELSQQHPVVICVDDAHFIDLPSLYCLLQLIRRLSTSRVLLVLSGQLDSRHSRPLFEREIFRLPNCKRVALNPLTQSGVTAILAQYLDAGCAERLGPACASVSGGNPLLAHALAEDLRSAGGQDPIRGRALSAPIVGEAFGRAMLSWLYRCDPAVLDIARAMAVLGDSVPGELVGRLLDIDPRLTQQIIHCRASGGVLNAACFAHESVQSAILAEISLDERQAMHSRAATLLYEDGAAAARVAQQLVAGSSTPTWASPVLRKAADEALADGEAQTAVGYLRQALGECTDADERIAIVALLNDAYWRLNPAAVTQHHPELLTAVRDGRLTGQAAVRVLSQLLWHGEAAKVADALDILQHKHGLVDSPLEALPWMHDLRLWLPHLYPGFAMGPAAENVAHPDAIASVWAPQHRAASALQGVLNGQQHQGDVIAMAEQALLSAGSNDSSMISAFAALMVLLYSDQLERATDWCDKVLKERPHPYGLVGRALLTVMSAEIRYRLGDLVEAEKQVTGALELVSAEGWGAAVAAPLSVMIRTTTALGKYREAAAWLDIPVPTAAFETLSGPHYLSARGHFYLKVGQSEAAIRDFTACGRLMQRWQIDSPAAVPWRTDIAQAYLCQNLVEPARELVADQLARLRPDWTRTRGITLKVQAATLGRKERVPLLHEAAELFENCGDRLELAGTLTELSHTYREVADSENANTVYRKAHRLVDQCHAEPLRTSLNAICHARRQSAGSDALTERQVLTKLSDAEHRVAELAARGHTNQQIAGKLYITVSTVEQHLTRVYRKLAVNRRSELPSRL